MENKRREARHPFIASAQLLDETSGSRLDARVSDLSFNGCYVDTVNPLPDGTAVQLKIFTQTHSFEAPALVVYAHAHLGMGMKFREVPPAFEKVLKFWLPGSEAAASAQAN